MSYVPIDPKIVPLLQGLKPYLGSKGQVVSEGILGLIQVLTSQHGQEAIKSMSKIYSVPGSSGERMITVNTAAGPVTFSLNLVFVLFLILILLLLSGNLLAFHLGMGNDGTPDIDQPASENISAV
ncbi:MAG: hypothetical protein WC834_08335 [Eubacteriales bacterium]